MAKPQMGAHVQLETETENYWYIIPVCLKHSMTAPSLEIDDTTVMASAHVNETCGKQLPLCAILPDEMPATLVTPPAVVEEKEKATVKELRERAASDTNRYYSKRKIKRVEPPALGMMY